MKKKIICAALALSAAFTAAGGAQFDWAKTAVDFCTKRGILSGMENGDLNLAGTLTREQMAKLLCDAFGLDVSFRREPTFNDIDEMRWSYGYIGAVSDYLFAGEKRDSINPSEEITREEFCATLAMAFGLTNASLRNPTLLDSNFSDAAKVSKSYKRLVGAAVERGLMSGADGALNPGGKLNRAEACSFLYRAVSVKEGKLTITPSDLGVIQSSTPMLGAPEATLEGAKAWAAKNGATDSFVDAAELYWKYGEITGIRPDILYAQAAKETGYGKYGGAVLPEQNNFAGIKKYGATGDATEDHEDFATQDDGVRGHFNHMSAYVGIAPVGEVHGRYNSVSKMSWAGSVKTLEQLGGKWCPDLYYGFSILHNYLEPMMKY